MIKILAIGNSFSEDATHFLHQIGEAANVENKVVNLYIGGCSLERHWKNIENDLSEYQYQLNGMRMDRYVSIREMFAEEEWDIVVLHQVSQDSGWMDSYEPFLGLILDYLKENAPTSKVFLNQTWAYEENSTHQNFMRYNRNQAEMYERLSKAYHAMADKYELPLIPSGELVQQLRTTKYFKSGVAARCICRDGFHLNWIYGRYAVGCLWAKKLFRIAIANNSFIPGDENMPEEIVDSEIIIMIQEMVERLAG